MFRLVQQLATQNVAKIYHHKQTALRTPPPRPVPYHLHKLISNLLQLLLPGGRGYLQCTHKMRHKFAANKAKCSENHPKVEKCTMDSSFMKYSCHPEGHAAPCLCSTTRAAAPGPKHPSICVSVYSTTEI